MRVPRFEIPAVAQPPKSIRVTLPAALLNEVESLASISGVEPASVIEHAVSFAFATRKVRHTRTRRKVE